jgi:hypothetical protein
VNYQSQPTLWKRLTIFLRALSIALRRTVLHLKLRYRRVPEQGTMGPGGAEISEIRPESEVASPASAVPVNRTRTGLLLSSQGKSTLPVMEENATHADHPDSELDDDSFEATEPDDLAELDSSESVLAGAATRVSLPPRERATPQAGLAVAAADTADDVSPSWLNEWFGPTSPRRNAWLFTTVTGVLGMILALLLLFSGHRPSQPPEKVKLASGTEQPDPFAEGTVTEESLSPPSEKSPPFEEDDQDNRPVIEPIVSRPVEPEPELKPEMKLEPQPDPETIVDVTDPPPPVETEPEPEDQFDLRVILLPDPDGMDQGEQFEVTGQETPVDLEGGFDSETLVAWREPLPEEEPLSDPWHDLEQLVPFGPLEPRDDAPRPTPRRELFAQFLTTQPPRGAHSLLMPFEMAVTNQGTAAIDRLKLTQTLPEGLRLRSTSAVHELDPAEHRLSWEFEDLAPEETWRIPMVVIPGADGPLTPATTLEAAVEVSSRTIVQSPEIQLEIVTDPHAPLNQYHRLLFRMTNVGEVPLTNLRMSVQLSENLWHRFGQRFVFKETGLNVGEVREALLHVKTLAEGEGTLNARLLTDDGAATSGTVAFAVGESTAAPARKSAPENATPTRSDSRPPGPDRTPEPRSRPAGETPLIRAAPNPEREPKPEPKPEHDPFPEFPGAIDPLPAESPRSESIQENPTRSEEPARTPDPPRREQTPPKDPFEIPREEPSEPDLFKPDR